MKIYQFNKTRDLIYKATRVRLLLFLVLVTTPGSAQVWQPSFQIGLNAEAASWGKDVSLSTYLSRNAAYNAGDHGCYLKISLFYFRVNGLGAIDSLYSKGSLNENLVSTIGGSCCHRMHFRRLIKSEFSLIFLNKTRISAYFRPHIEGFTL